MKFFTFGGGVETKSPPRAVLKCEGRANIILFGERPKRKFDYAILLAK